VDVSELKKLFDSLPVWSGRDSFRRDDWTKYLQVADTVHQTDPQIVEAALDQFVKGALLEPFMGYEIESKLFLLMRVVFDLPESAPQESRLSFKGWTNWPNPDANGNVSLAWPLTWRDGKPQLVNSYEGSEGKPYAATAEYRYLREHFPYRDLRDVVNRLGA
jgi:hypothetical protein